MYNCNSDDEEVSPFQVSLLEGSIMGIKQILCTKYHANLSRRKKNKKIVKICLELKIDVNLPKSKYSALLHFVSTKLDEETFKTVLSRTSKDCNINATYKGRALLHFMSEQGKENLAKYLIEFGADVNVKDNDGKTPLFYAVKESIPIIVRTLLNHGAEIYDNQLPLEIFFITFYSPSHVEIPKMLLEAGYDVSPENKGMLPISKIFDEDTLYSMSYVDSCQNWEIVRLMCAHGAEICLKNDIGTEILHSFCAAGRLDDVRFSVKLGADLFSILNGETALHKAVLGNNIDLVDYLLCHGLDINARNKDGEAPLARIVSNQNCKKAFPIVYLFPEDDREDPDEEKKCIELMEFLVDNGANVNAFHGVLNHIKDCIYNNLLELTEYLLELKGIIDFREDFPFFCFEKEYCENSVMYDILTAFLAMGIYNISPYICDYAGPYNREWAESSFEQCKTEVREMRVTNIYQGRNISFFDFLSQDLREIAIIFCRSEEMMLVLESGKYKKEFPSYEYLLGKRIARVQLLRNSINLLTHFLEKISNTELPIPILDTILSFLGAGDLRNFARALRISKDFPNGKYCIE